jgi:hypothetical protein
MSLRAVFLAGIATATVLLGLLAPQAEAAVPANGRAWELVTVNPPSSSRVMGLRPISENGDRLVYGAVGPPKGSESGAMTAVGTSIRGAAGWIDVPVGIPFQSNVGASILLLAPILPVAFTADEETTLWLSRVPLTPGAPPESQLSLYRQPPGAAPQFVARVSENDPPVATADYGLFSDIANDGSRVVFVSEEHLVPADAARAAGTSVYAWDESGLELLDVDAGGNLLSICGGSVSDANGMSASADRVFVSVLSACGSLARVYLADLNADSRIEISASRCTRVDCNTAADVNFAGATPEGEFAYMTTTQQLTNADEDAGRDLYRYAAATDQLTLLSGAASAVTGEVVDGLVFPSKAGERVYFRASGEILPGEATPGEKLFMADGSGLHLVAQATFPASAEIQLSTNGNRALFVTQTPIFGDDTDSQGDAYLYDAPAAALSRVSAGPVGGNGEHPVRIEPLEPVNRHELEFGVTRPYYAIDAAGERVFFQTDESLVSEDTNGLADVYEWWNGQLGLVSPGNQPLRSDFGGISRDGRSVIFATNASLVRRDADGESRDLYSARLGGGFPEPPESPGCDSSTCPLPLGQRITRPPLPSMTKLGDRRGALRVLEVAAKAKKGAITVVVSVPAPGLVSAQIWTRAKGKKVVLAAGSKRVKKAGKAELKLLLTRSARRAPGGAKDAQLTVSQGASRASQTVKVSLR